MKKRLSELLTSIDGKRKCLFALIFFMSIFGWWSYFDLKFQTNNAKIISPDIEDSNLPLQKKNMAANQAMIMPNGVSVPSDFPHVNITVNNNPSSEYFFLSWLKISEFLYRALFSECIWLPQHRSFEAYECP